MRIFRSAVVFALVFAVGACATVPADKFPDPGHIFVKVMDQNSAGVSGVTVQLILRDGSLLWRSAVTDGSGSAAPGEADGGVLPGDYDAKIILPAGYALAASQTNPVAITIQSNRRIDLTFKVTTSP